MEYTVSFNFNCINKKNAVSGKSGQVEINAESSPEELRNSSELFALISSEMAQKTKQSILSIEITDIVEKKKK